MKFTSKFLVCVFTAVSVMLSVKPVGAVTYGKSGDFDYKIENDKAIIWHYNGNDENVTVPATVNSIPVEKIDNVLFTNNLKIKSVVVEEGITTLGDFVFNGCKSIESVVLPESITYISGPAFRECTSLKSIVLPSQIEHIPGQIFSGCNSLSSVKLPAKLLTIGDMAFKDCFSLASVKFPETLQEIGGNAFQNCGSLKTLTIPGSVQNIDWFAFDNCSELTKVKINSGLKSIDFSAFGNCPKLRQTYIPASVKNINFGVFNKSPNVTIYAPRGSYAQTYANENKIDFREDTADLSKPAAIDKPSSVTAKSVGASTVKISWKKVAGASGYEIRYSIDNKKYTTAGIAQGTSFTKKGLKIGTKYYFKVRAYKIAGKSKIYGDFSAVSSAGSALAKVGSLKAVPAKNKVKLTWAKTPGASGYEVYYSADGKSFKKCGSVTNGSRTVYEQSKLKGNTKYYFKVRAYSGTGKARVNGAFSGVSAKTK